MSSPSPVLPPEEHPAEKPIYVREQYRFKERKLVTVSSSAPLFTYTPATKTAAVVLITTDSVIQYDVQDIGVDSPQMAGSTTTYDRITLPIERTDPPKNLYFKWISGSGNIWLVIGD